MEINLTIGDMEELRTESLPSATDPEPLSLGEVPMVYKAHAVVGAAIFIEGILNNHIATWNNKLNIHLIKITI